MATTVKKIIKKMMQKSGVLTKSEEPDADEAQDALDAINAMLSSWSNDTMLVPARIWETFTLLGGIGEYTIGPGVIAPNFNTARPIAIIAATVKFGDTTTPVTVIDDEIYFNQIAVKNIPGLPQYLTYDNAYPVAKMRFWSIPGSNYELALLSEKMLSQFALNDSFDLAPGWERAIIYNGAIEIASDYGQEPPAATVNIAGESKSLIVKAVNRNRSLDASPQQGRSGNIFTGYWNR